MDLKQLEYMIKIAQENNITKAAEKLFITQSALNQQLLRLEKSLGTELFVRSRNNWHLTEAGQIYVHNAKKIVRIKKETYHRISDLIETKEGHLTVGLTPERGVEMFAAIYPALYQKYPKVKMEPLEMSVKRQQAEIAQGNLDIGFLTLQDHQKTNDTHIQICTEQIILVVPKAHPLAHLGGGFGERLPEISLKMFENDLFAIISKGSTLRDLYDNFITEENICPPILLETRSCQTLFELAAGGICCTVIPITYTKPSTKVSYFSIVQNPVWEVAVSYKKDSYLSHAAKELIALSTDYWEQKINNMPYGRI